MRTFNKFICFAGCLSILLSLFSCGTGSGLTVVFPNIGSADAALVMTKNATVLIDTGETSDSRVILELLKEYRRDSIDLFVISHYDKDHVGGAAGILEAVPVGRVIGSTSPKVSDEMSAYLLALSAAGLTEEIPSQRLTIRLDGMEITIDPPARSVYSEEQSNNSSLLLTVTYGNTCLLFTGDAMTQRLEEIHWEDNAFDLVKIPHHGRDFDNLAYYLPSLKDGAVAVITSSKKESESSKLVSALEETGTVPFLTRKGAVVVNSDGSHLTVVQDS